MHRAQVQGTLSDCENGHTIPRTHTGKEGAEVERHTHLQLFAGTHVSVNANTYFVFPERQIK